MKYCQILGKTKSLHKIPIQKIYKHRTKNDKALIRYNHKSKIGLITINRLDFISDHSYHRNVKIFHSSKNF